MNDSGDSPQAKIDQQSIAFNAYKEISPAENQHEQSLCARVLRVEDNKTNQMVAAACTAHVMHEDKALVKNIDTDQATSNAELSDTDSQIDTAILETMPGGAAKRPRILNMFLTSMQKQLTAMHDGLAMADTISIMESAHTLKSSSATVGATGLSELCKTLEHATSQGEATDGDAMVAEIDRISQLVEQEIRSAYL